MAFLDETGLAELWSLIKGEDGKLQTLIDDRAKIATGSYKGTDGAGASNKNSLTFAFEPKLVIVYSATTYGGGHPDLSPLFMIRGAHGTTPDGASDSSNWGYVTTTWSGNTVSWYASSYSLQKNSSSWTYYYVAIG